MDCIFAFELGQRVTTPFGDPAIIVSAAINRGGRLYHVKLRDGTEDWWYEDQLAHELRPRSNPAPDRPGMVAGQVGDPPAGAAKPEPPPATPRSGSSVAPGVDFCRPAPPEA